MKFQIRWRIWRIFIDQRSKFKRLFVFCFVSLFFTPSRRCVCNQFSAPWAVLEKSRHLKCGQWKACARSRDLYRFLRSSIGDCGIPDSFLVYISLSEKGFLCEDLACITAKSWRFPVDRLPCVLSFFPFFTKLWRTKTSTSRLLMTMKLFRVETHN